MKGCRGVEWKAEEKKEEGAHNTEETLKITAETKARTQKK